MITKIPLNQRRIEPDLCMVLEQLADQIKVETNCILIGTIVSFNATEQTANISVNYKRVNLFDGTTTEYPMLIRCPVIILNGGTSYITFPIMAGDSCLVLFCDREIDTWFINGGVNAPQSARIHDLNDGIALVGIRNSLNSIANYPTDRIRLYHGGVIDIKDGDIFTVPLTDYSNISVIVGWDPLTFLTKKIFYKKLGKSVDVYFEILGTSNSAITTITLPYAVSSTQPNVDEIIESVDDGSEQAGEAEILAGLSLVTFYKTMGDPSWTTHGVKHVHGHIRYEAE
jgi:hypothetical protein